MAPPDTSDSQWTRRPDDPRWYWEIHFDSETVPVKTGYADGPGLNVLDEVVRELPDLIYQSPTEPAAVKISLDGIPF